MAAQSLAANYSNLFKSLRFPVSTAVSCTVRGNKSLSKKVLNYVQTAEFMTRRLNPFQKKPSFSVSARYGLIFIGSGEKVDDETAAIHLPR